MALKEIFMVMQRTTENTKKQKEVEGKSLLSFLPYFF